MSKKKSDKDKKQEILKNDSMILSNADQLNDQSLTEQEREDLDKIVDYATLWSGGKKNNFQLFKDHTFQILNNEIKKMPFNKEQQIYLDIRIYKDLYEIEYTDEYGNITYGINSESPLKTLNFLRA